jgi:trk system potassium uptake protein TrkH
VRLIKAVVITTLAIEILGAALLFPVFYRDFPASTAAYHALFHAVSAFCNAGFSTFSTSLEHYRGNYYLVFVFAFLIIIGGLGFAVITELADKFRKRSITLSLHTKLCLAATLLLLAAGTVLLILAEIENGETFANPANGIVNCFFQAVTSRTAGFNTVPQQSFTEVGLLLTMVLMFIGACPGSTAGGIKATTLAVIVLLVVNRFRGRQTVAVFRRSISDDSIRRALTVALLSVLVIIFVFGLLMYAEERPLAHRLTHGWFVDNLFESVSAFGTVGLSLGRTGDLTNLGKIITIVTMFIGRVGLLTLAFSLARPPQRGEVSYLDETVMVG